MQNELRAPARRHGRAGRRRRGPDGRARRRPRWSSDDRVTRRAPTGRGAGPGRDRWRATLEREGASARPRAARALRDLVRDRDPRPLHRRPTPPASTRTATSGRPGRVPVHARRPADDVPRPPLDDAPVRRLRDGRGDQPALPLPARAGPDRPVGRLRPADPDGLRLRRARRREGEVGRVGVPISSLADMEILLDGLPLGEVSTSMTINAHGADPARPLRRRGRGAGRRARDRLAARSRTTSSRSTSPAAPTSTRRGRRCAS